LRRGIVDKSHRSIHQSPHPKSNASHPLSALNHLIAASQNYLAGLSRYASDFMVPYIISTGYFRTVEEERLRTTSPVESLESYL